MINVNRILTVKPSHYSSHLLKIFVLTQFYVEMTKFFGLPRLFFFLRFQVDHWYVLVTQSMTTAHIRDDYERTSAYGVDYHAVSRVFEWRDEYFDLVQELPATHAIAAHHFQALNHHFIAIASLVNNKGECCNYRYKKVEGSEY